MRLFGWMLTAVLALPLAGCLDSGKPELFVANLGGTVSGLSGTVTLVLNDSETLQITSDGSFGFRTLFDLGQAYAVTVGTQPANQTCSVANATGILPRTISNVAVTCVTDTYAVGGNVFGLNGTVGLQNGNDLIVLSANGSFAFPTRAQPGSPYAIAVHTQPAGATCNVSSGDGTVGSQDITSIAVSCQANTHALGGILTGLAGSLTLSRNGEHLTLDTNGSFAFPTPVAEGATYAITVQTQPAAQTCDIIGGTGTMGVSDVSNVTVTCTHNIFTVGGSISGLITGYVSDVVLEINGGDTLAVVSDGGFVFPTPLTMGASYTVAVTTQPSVPAQHCTVSHGSGIVLGDDITNVSITCAAPASRYAYVTDISGTTIGAFSVDSASGAITPASSNANGSNSYDIGITPDKRFLYVPNMSTNDIAGYSINSVDGTLTPISGSPFAIVGDRPRTLSITPDGRFVHVVNQGGNSISTLAINATTGALTASGSPVPTGDQPADSLITPSGKYLYVASLSDRNVSAYALNATTGVPTHLGYYPVPIAARALVMDPRGKFLYVSDYNSLVRGFQIDDGTGALTPIPGSPFATGGGAPSLGVIDSGGKFLYVTNVGSNNISAYRIEPTTGTLTTLPGSPIDNIVSPSGITADPSGRFLYVSGVSQLRVYNIDSSTGALTAISGSPFSTPSLNPGAIAILPD